MTLATANRTAPRPVIGVTAALGRAGDGLWIDEAAYVARSYVDAVVVAGGLPLLIPPFVAGIDVVLARLDGLILSGGPDIDPVHYGQERHPETEAAQPERDAFELALARQALARDLPLLGICRGMQVLNVALGGTLHQHLPDVVGHHLHRVTRFEFADGGPVRLEDGSLAERAAGARYVARTPSSHHQGVDRLGEGLVASGFADDGSIVALERPASEFVLGVQWHPEVDQGNEIVAALVATSGVFAEVAA